MVEQKIFKELNKSLKYRARRSKVLATDFEDAEGSGEVTVSVADDRELDALQQKDGKQDGQGFDVLQQQDPRWLMLLCGTFSSAEFMSIVLTVTWLSVHTPTTCTMCKVKTNTVCTVLSESEPPKPTWAPMALKSESFSLKSLHSPASSSDNL